MRGKTDLAGAVDQYVQCGLCRAAVVGLFEEK